MKLRALYDCRNHWQWLWITGTYYKKSYEPARKWKFNCALCEYMGHEGDGVNSNGDYDAGHYVCDDCPLTGYAWDNDPDRRFAPCDIEGTNSCYHAWNNADHREERQYYAHKMVMACNRAIEKELTK